MTLRLRLFRRAAVFSRAEGRATLRLAIRGGGRTALVLEPTTDIAR